MEHPQLVIDSHIHVIDRKNIKYSFLKAYDEKWGLPVGSHDSDNWGVDNYMTAIAKDPKFKVKGTLIMETAYDLSLNDEDFFQNSQSEARWIQKLCETHEQFIGFMPLITISHGKAYVERYLNEMRDSNGKLSKYLKAARRNMINQPVGTCITQNYYEGLKVLEKEGITWEILLTMTNFEDALKMVQDFPNMKFCQNHCGNNLIFQFENHWEQWIHYISEFAKHKNIVCKMSDIEEWGVPDFIPYMKHCLQAFGFDRCLAESNWFLIECFGHAYSLPYQLLLKSCEELGATQDEKDMVFFKNAEKFYNIN